MKLITQTRLRRPSTLPVLERAAHGTDVGRRAVRGMLTNLRTAPGGIGCDGITVSIDSLKIAGAGAAAATPQAFGDVRGVPPRGRPV